MIFLGLDIIMTILGFTSYFFLVNIVLISKNNIWKLLLITLVLDVLILNVYFVNTIILGIIFGCYKKLGIKRVNLVNYILSLSFIYILYVLAIGLINSYSLKYLASFMINNYIWNMIFYVLCYKLVGSNIKLSR